MGNMSASADALQAAAVQVRGALDDVVDEAAAWLASRQADDGHWVFELEADATIPAEYILLNHYLGDINDEIEAKLGNYLRRRQGRHGGWPLYHDGDFDISATVKAYYALKCIGDDPDAAHMKRARQAILSRGGAAEVNVFTRIALALFGQVPWRAVPWMRPEAMLLPKWAPFHINKVSYWSRTVMVPLFVLAALKPRAVNPRNISIEELFTVPPEQQKGYLKNPTGHPLGDLLLVVDKLGRLCDPLFPEFLEKKAIDKAMNFVKERFNGEDGLGGIFPAMAYAVMALDALGCRRDDPEFVTARRAIDKLVVIRDEEGYCQPCVSPVWDTSLAVHSMLEAGFTADDPIIVKANKWLRDRQVLGVYGDWKANSGDVRPGGWAFQYWNDHYPDVDDTAVVVLALDRAGHEESRKAVDRGAEWVLGMESDSGGWGAFDANNEHYSLNNIPFADHGALLDPPSADVTARCLGMLAQLGYDRSHPTVVRSLDYLKAQQEEDGSWFGRWGTNYVYGTWSVLCALNATGEDPSAPYIRKAVEWLKSRQREDGGWGEDCASYWPERKQETKASTPSQTAWAVLGLMAAGEVDSEHVRRGIGYLLDAQREGGKWREEYYNAVGFPKVFYLSYHGYSAYFPLWALARYRNLSQSNAKTTMYGI